MKHRLLPPTLLTASLLLCLPALADNTAANTALQQGRVDDALHLLQSTLAAQPNDATAHQLLCRVFYAQDLSDPAVNECEKAVAADPRSSDNQMWLGRSYGLKASQSSIFAGMTLAKKVHLAFERAVELSPSNTQAASDLGEFYVAAPSIAGGGLDKAEHLATAVLPYSPSRAHRILGFVAEKRKDTSKAEAEFKAEVASGDNAPALSVDLAIFYQRQNRFDEAVTILQNVIDRSHDSTLADAASVLIDIKRSPDLAEKALRAYLASPQKSDNAPVFKVHLQLGHLMAQRGDTAGAKREYAIAVKLAPAFAPARKALQEA